MARAEISMDSDRDDTGNCNVCYEEFSESGATTPRILPCHHTVCTSCLSQLVRQGGNAFLCPECRKKHRADQGVKTFQQNKYILKYIQGKRKLQKEKSKFEKCSDHNRDATIYCATLGCKKVICSGCLLDGHKDHELKDVLEERESRKEEILSKVKPVIKKHRLLKEKIQQTESGFGAKRQACRRDIRSVKRDQIRQLEEKCDEMLSEVDDNWQKTEASLSEKRVAADSNLELLSEIAVKIPGVKSLSALGKMGDWVNHVIRISERQSKDLNTYSYHVFQKPEGATEPNVGHLEEMEERFCFKDRCIIEDEDAIATEFSSITVMCMAPGNREVVVAGRENGFATLAVFCLCESRLVRTVRTKTVPDFMAGVEHEGKHCVALCYRDLQLIEFHGVPGLAVVSVFSTAPDMPTVMCKMSPTMLLCHLVSENMDRRIRRVDCSQSSLKYTGGKIQIPCDPVDMCYMPDTDVLCITSAEGVLAWNINVPGSIWTVNGKMVGLTKPGRITTDGKGQIFVADADDDMYHLISSDGEHKGIVHENVTACAAWYHNYTRVVVEKSLQLIVLKFKY